MMEEAPGIFSFLARFHPLVVHLPIGFLALIILFEMSGQLKSLKKLAPAINTIWLFSAISAAVSVVCGWQLSLDGGYDDATITLHKWSGIVLTIFCVAGYTATRLPARSRSRMISYKVLVVLVAVALISTGHWGGSLTHGADYLIEFDASSSERPRVTSLDSADIFSDAVAPILDSRCNSCHNTSKRKGKLLLTTYENIMKGGKSGPAVVSGNPEASEMYKRITLPHEDKKFMPAEGKKPLNKEQLAIIRWWIEKGAPQQASIKSLSPDPKMRSLFERFYGIGNSIALTAPSADTNAVKSLSNMGFRVRALARNSNLLEARLHENKSGKQGIDALSKITEQLLWLYLDNRNLTDDDLPALATLTRLRKLNLSHNPVTDKTIRYLMPLRDLEYLNLYDTQVSDAGVDSLLTLPHLKELYLWQTRVTVEHMEKCSQTRPGVKLIYRTPE